MLKTIYDSPKIPRPGQTESFIHCAQQLSFFIETEDDKRGAERLDDDDDAVGGPCCCCCCKKSLVCKGNGFSLAVIIVMASYRYAYTDGRPIRALYSSLAC